MTTDASTTAGSSGTSRYSTSPAVRCSRPLSQAGRRRIACMTDTGATDHMEDDDREERRRKIDEALAYRRVHDAQLLKRLEDA